MKRTIAGVPVRWLVSLSLAGIALPILQAEHCPGNVASVPLHLVNRYLFIVAVSINHSGPYDFLLDTGTQTTTVDCSLAGELHLNLEGAPVVEGIGFQATASSARLELIETGTPRHWPPDGCGIQLPETGGRRPAHSRCPGRGFPRALRHAHRQCSRPDMS